MTPIKFSVSQTKVYHSFFILVLIFFYIAILCNVVHAQNKYTGKGSFDIWNSNEFFAGQGYTAYEFTIDTLGLIVSNIQDISDFIIQTNSGDIIFNGTINISTAGRYSTGTLHSQEAITEIQIIKVVGVVDGKMLDLTDQLSVREFVPMKITTSASAKPSGEAACPDKILDSGTETGVYISTECVDGCHLKIKRDRNGKEELFLQYADLMGFKANPGTKVIYDYQNTRTFFHMGDPADGECIDLLTITSIKEVK
jgi:hypothetical protein